MRVHGLAQGQTCRVGRGPWVACSLCKAALTCPDSLSLMQGRLWLAVLVGACSICLLVL